MTVCPEPLQPSNRNNVTKKTAELTRIMFIIDTFSHSDSLKKGELAKKNYFDTTVGGRQDKLPWTACPTTSATTHMKQCDKKPKLILT